MDKIEQLAAELMARAIRSQQTPSVHLRPCPFCAGTPFLYVHELASVPELEPHYQVECSECGATGPARDNPFHAEEWWNRDHLSTAIRERNEDAT